MYKPGDRVRIKPGTFTDRGVGIVLSVKSSYYVVKFEKNYEPTDVDGCWIIKTDDNKCEHVFVEYNGFTESYKYCKLCDMKE